MKVAKSYQSLLNGVSQQVAHSRSPGQHTEQVNLLSDPVNGLIRRQGSEFVNEVLFKTTAGLDPDYASLVSDTATWSSIDWATGGKEYVVLYRKGSASSTSPALVVYNKTDNAFLTLTENGADTPMNHLRSNGVACVAPVGKYLYLCANNLVAGGSESEIWNTPSNLGKAAIWFRSGVANRKYRIKIYWQAGGSFAAEYTTPTASYAGTLSTSDIPAAATDYQKQVNDRVNAYNSAVTAWIQDASTKTQPAYIASMISAALTTAGHAHTVSGSTIGFNSSLVKSIEVDDNGDGSLIRAVADEIDSADKVSTWHYPGKVVKVRSKNSTEAYYLKAVSKSGETSAFSEVTWTEGAADTKQAFTSGLYNLTIVGSQVYCASSPAVLNALVPGGGVPQLVASTVGDDESNPQPAFVGKQVTYLGVFQSRLLVGSGGTISLSKTDDFLNFYRSTVLTVPGDDPFEMTPQGSESDYIKYSVLYDQNLVIFGTKRQYLISGAQALTPTAANMPVMSSYRDVVDAPPTAAGGLIFYTKRTGGASGFHQIQPGQNYNSPDSFPVSSQLADYIVGGVVGMSYLPGTPSFLFARTDAYRNGLYVFSYLDVQGGRKMDSWSRWEFHQDLGSIVGTSTLLDKLLVFSIRQRGSLTYVVVDSCGLSTAATGKPYLDSQRPWASLSGSLQSSTAGGFKAVYDNSTTKYLRGTALATAAASATLWPRAGLVVGSEFPAYVTLTNPYMVDGKEKVILSGRLTVSKLIVAYKSTNGMTWDLAHQGIVSTSTFNGRTLGDPVNLLGIEPVSTGQHSIPVGRETRDYSLTISARKWGPLNITAIEWGGQFFNRVQRF